MGECLGSICPQWRVYRGVRAHCVTIKEEDRNLGYCGRGGPATRYDAFKDPALKE